MKRNIFIKTLIGAVSIVSLTSVSSAEQNEKKPKPYPLKTCIVSEEKLGEMGKPKYLNYKGQIYGFCCTPCTKDFRDNPEKFRKKFEKLTKPNKK